MKPPSRRPRSSSRSTSTPARSTASTTTRPRVTTTAPPSSRGNARSACSKKRSGRPLQPAPRRADERMVTRRRFLAQTAPVTLASWLGACGGRGGTAITPYGGAPQAALLPPGSIFDFLHGVASGDPLADAVILWTRVTPLLPEASTGTDAGSASGSPEE